MCKVIHFRITKSYLYYHPGISLAGQDKWKKDENTYWQRMTVSHQPNMPVNTRDSRRPQTNYF